MPSAAEIGLRIHQALYVRSDGRVGHRLIGAPSLLLRTTGRRTGIRRTNALIYAEDGPRFVVVASNHGRDRPPGWLLNLQVNPEVEIQLGRRRMAATARIVEAGSPDHARLWGLANAINRNRYDAYQARTRRPIALVVLEPHVASRGSAP